MRLTDYLSVFSVEDLRELAARRRIRLSREALNGRQTLVPTLASALGQYENLYATVTQMNEAELAALKHLLEAPQPSLSGLAAAAGAESAAVKPILESLRLWGLVFPEGDWEHIAIPGPTRLAAHYLEGQPRLPRPDLRFTPPPVAPAAGGKCAPRPGSTGWDIAELLARVARSRLKLTQAGRVNRRDLRVIEGSLAVPAPGYAVFLSILVGGLRLLGVAREGILTVLDGADEWLARPEAERARSAARGWTQLAGYPENAQGDPADAGYLPQLLYRQRGRVLEIVEGLEPGLPVSTDSVAARLAWLLPWSRRQWDASRDVAGVTRRMLRSLYWLGIVALDDPEEPRVVQLTPLGERALGTETPGLPGLVPEDPLFFVQPNAEIFAPPNLSPRSYFHLRRVTAEKRTGPAGMFGITADSVRRALDSGLTVSEIALFLERFSRTGLPANVRALVETAGRQHGRIRLVPIEFALVAEEPALLEELKNLKTVEPLLGRPVAERVAAVAAADVPDLMRRLRQRGYAPLNEAEIGDSLTLPGDPDTVPAPRAGGEERAAEFDWNSVAEGTPPPVEPGPRVTGREALRGLANRAVSERLVLEIEYHGRRGETTLRRIWPISVEGDTVAAHCCLREAPRSFDLERIAWARLTGERFESGNV